MSDNNPPENPNDVPPAGDPPAPPAGTPPAGDPPAGDPPPAPPAADPDSAEALRRLDEISRKLDQPRTPATPSNPADEMERLKAETGLTEEQIRYQQQLLANAVAPVQEKMAWMDLQTRFPDLQKFKAEMDKELKDGYSPMQKANPVILEKVYYLVKGRTMSQTPTPQPPPPTRTRIAGFPGSQPGGDSSNRGGAAVLTDEEKQYARVAGISEDQYRKAKGSKYVRDLK